MQRYSARATLSAESKKSAKLRSEPYDHWVFTPTRSWVAGVGDPESTTRIALVGSQAGAVACRRVDQRMAGTGGLSLASAKGLQASRL